PLLLHPGMTLEIPFTVHPEAWGAKPPNVLELLLGGDGFFTMPSSPSSVIDTLWDGSNLLGTYSNPISTPYTTFTGLDFGGKWRDANGVSPYGTPIDFSSILNGSINGRIDITYLGPANLPSDSVEAGGFYLDPSRYGPYLGLLRYDQSGGAF